jgi:hypothetical protein
MGSELLNKGLTDMASGGKRKTTMAKLNRESKLREKRQDKLARKEARKLAAENPDSAFGVVGEDTAVATAEPDAETGVQVHADAPGVGVSGVASR